LVFLILAGNNFQTHSQGAGQTRRYRPGVLLVGFESEATREQRELTLAAWGLGLQAEHPKLGVVEVAVPDGREFALADALARAPGVRFAEPDYFAQAELIPNDPRWADQWGPQRIGADQAWDRVPAVHGLMIAVLDSGITLDHSDLKARIWTNPGEIPDNGIDDDQNGKIDDVHGWHFYTCVGPGTCPGQDNNIRDDYGHGHGTQVAGIIAADSNNGIGIAGLAWQATILPVKVLDEFGSGAYSDIAEGIVYATDNGATILNLSLGGSDPSETLRAAVHYALNRNRVVIAAAGNNGKAIQYPAAIEGVIAVGATDRADQQASFSNGGPELDLVAPGVDILSTSRYYDGYFVASGTSFAAPHVAGVAALVWAAAPALTALQVRETLEQTAVDLGPVGYDTGTGYGRLDAAAAINRVLGVLPTPAPTSSPTTSATPSPSPGPPSTPTPSWTPTFTPTSLLLPSPSLTSIALPSSTPGATLTLTTSPSSTPTPSVSATATPVLPTPSATTTFTPTASVTASPIPTARPTRPADYFLTWYFPFARLSSNPKYVGPY